LLITSRFVGSFDEFAVLEPRASADQGDQAGCVAWVFGGGLLPPDTATVVRVDNGKTTMTDGPFAETKEQLGGFSVLQCADPGPGAGLGGEVVRTARCRRSRR
jgi:hypothetical protein